jgi:hypothetical protein
MQYDRDGSLSALWAWIGNESSARLREILMADISRLDSHFLRLNDEEKMRTYVGYRYALGASDTLGVWQLGCLLDGFSLADDAFKDFRRALILQGKYIFGLAVDSPDDIADCITNNDAVPELSVGTMGALDDFGAKTRLRLQIPHSNEVYGVNPASRARISARLPKLWSLIGDKYRYDYESSTGRRLDGSVSECGIPGLGVVRVGDRIRRKSNGKIFVVLAIEDSKKGILQVDKGDGVVGPLLIISELYEACGKV